MNPISSFPRKSPDPALGTLAGGYVIETTGEVAIVYVGIGAAIVVLALAYSFAPGVGERSGRPTE